MNQIILAKRRTGGSYRVEFFQDKGRARIRCNCAAGSVGQICRHKRGLLSGSTRMLFNPEQRTLLGEILSWPEMRSLVARARAYETQLSDIDSKKDVLEQQEKVLMSRFASDCLDGVHDD